MLYVVCVPHIMHMCQSPGAQSSNSAGISSPWLLIFLLYFPIDGFDECDMSLLYYVDTDAAAAAAAI